jgi:hypothetical protein
MRLFADCVSGGISEVGELGKLSESYGSQYMTVRISSGFMDWLSSLWAKPSKEHSPRYLKNLKIKSIGSQYSHNCMHVQFFAALGRSIHIRVSAGNSACEARHVNPMIETVASDKCLNEHQ